VKKMLLSVEKEKIFEQINSGSIGTQTISISLSLDRAEPEQTPVHNSNDISNSSLSSSSSSSSSASSPSITTSQIRLITTDDSPESFELNSFLPESPTTCTSKRRMTTENMLSRDSFLSANSINNINSKRRRSFQDDSENEGESPLDPKDKVVLSAILTIEALTADEPTLTSYPKDSNWKSFQEETIKFPSLSSLASSSLSSVSSSSTPTITSVAGLLQPFKPGFEIDGEGEKVQKTIMTQQEQKQLDSSQDDSNFDPYLFLGRLPGLRDELMLWSQNFNLNHSFNLNLNSSESSTPEASPRFCLPSKAQDAPPHTLVLDLDETLVHCTMSPIPNPDMVFPVDFNDETFLVYVLKRPHLEHFLETVSKQFEVVLFTASQYIYANTLLDLLDKDKKWIRHRLFRESCLCIEGNYMKELSILGRDLSKTIIIDNSPQAFGFQLSNGIPIESWYDDPNDKELLDIIPFLESLINVSDVRPIIREKFQLHKRVEAYYSS